MLSYLNRNLTYLRDGSLPNRLQNRFHQWNWHQYVVSKRVAWWESQVGKREAVEIRIQPGVQTQLYFDSDLCRLIYRGSFEYQERQFLNAFLRPGDVFVDVGANIGLFTLTAAKLVKKTGRVYAFEPCSKTHQRLLKNVKLNHLTNVSCHQLALSDKTGQIDMTVSLDGFDAWNSLAQPIAGESFAVETITSTKWDDFVREYNLIKGVTMMKIDVEGWETYVLSGGFETLSRMDAPVLQVEFTEKASQSADSSCQKLYHSLEKLGYQMFIYDPESKEIIHDPLRESYPYLNLIAAKQPEQVVARLKSGSHAPWLR